MERLVHAGPEDLPSYEQLPQPSHSPTHKGTEGQQQLSEHLYFLSPRKQLLDSIHHITPGQAGLIPGLHHQAVQSGDQACGVQEGWDGEDGGQVGWGQEQH